MQAESVMKSQLQDVKDGTRYVHTLTPDLPKNLRQCQGPILQQALRGRITIHARMVHQLLQQSALK
jgi:hypothetical protein